VALADVWITQLPWWQMLAGWTAADFTFFPRMKKEDPFNEKGSRNGTKKQK